MSILLEDLPDCKIIGGGKLLHEAQTYEVLMDKRPAVEKLQDEVSKKRKHYEELEEDVALLKTALKKIKTALSSF